MMRSAYLCLLPLFAIFAQSAPAQEQPALTLSEPTFQRGATEHTWLYHLQLTNVPPSGATFMLYLRIPERTLVHDITTNAVTSRSHRLSDFTEVTLMANTDATVPLKVTGRVSDVKAGPPVEHQWRIDAGARLDIRASAPEVLYDPSIIRFVFGPGLVYRADDYIDFAVSDDETALLIVNDSRLRTTASVGALSARTTL